MHLGWQLEANSRPFALGCLLRPLPPQPGLFFDHHNYIFATKLETHLLCFLKWETILLYVLSWRRKALGGLFFYVDLFERRQSLLITTNHRITSASQLLPLHHRVPASFPKPPIILLLYWHMVQPPDGWRCGEGVVQPFRPSSLRVAKFTGSCWRSDAGGRTSPRPRRCRRHLWEAQNGRMVDKRAKSDGAMNLGWEARTCVASVQVNTCTVVSAAAAHHVVLEIRLGHVQRRVDLHLRGDNSTDFPRMLVCKRRQNFFAVFDSSDWSSLTSEQQKNGWCSHSINFV